MIARTLTMPTAMNAHSAMRAVTKPSARRSL
jgi:hypothetical protein